MITQNDQSSFQRPATISSAPQVFHNTFLKLGSGFLATSLSHSTLNAS